MMPFIFLTGPAGGGVGNQQGPQLSVQLTVINLQYFVTPPGIIKIVQFLIGLILLFLEIPVWLSIINYLTFSLSNIWICIYVFSLQRRVIIKPPWIVLEFYYTVGAAVLFGLGTLIGIVIMHWVTSGFAMVNTAAYGAGSFFLFQDWGVWKKNQVVPNVPI